MTTEITTLQKAWYTISQLKQRLKSQEMTMTSSPIAIVGLSCRFPGAPNKNAFWQLLCSGKNVISHFPEERWQLLKETDEFCQRDATHSYWGGYLQNITHFDPYFFGISPREAMRMDPQQRILLEVAYEAIEDAGIAMETLANSRTGVFTSLYASQFGYLQKLDDELDALFIPTGNAAAMGANRLSYLFDLRGPSMIVDTACSSSLVGVHLACLNLQNNECEQAIVSAVNINLFPSINLLLAKAKMLSPDGQCKTFDAGANGYVQGEGAGAILLKKLDQAKKDKDRIYAVILGSAVNQDGKTNGLTAPNGLQQEVLIRSLYKTIDINPEKIAYIECHGTGTFLGDPIEVQALGEAIGTNRSSENPCWLGSVKTNIGHLEPAAGIASIIKVALSLKHSQIPQHLNVAKRNPLIEFDKYHFQIPQELQTWPKYGEYRVGGISGFGFGGTNAHIVLSEMISDDNVTPEENIARDTEIFLCSAKDLTALTQYVAQWCFYLEQNLSVGLDKICYNTHVRRPHFFYRLAILANTTAELYQALCSVNKKQFTIGETIFISNEKNIKPKNIDNTMKITDISIQSLADFYVNHAVIDWKEYEKKRSLPHIDLPTYPWQHKTYWPNFKRIEQAEVDSYPFQGKWIDSPLPVIQIEFQFDVEKIPEIKDTYNILHAGYYLEMLAFAAKEVLKQSDFTISDLTFSAPIIIPENKSIAVQLLLEKMDEKSFLFTFYSSTDIQNNWKEHSKGKLLLEAQIYCKNDSILQVKQRSLLNEKSDVFYSRVRAMDMPVDGSIRWVHQYWLGDHEVLCELKSPNTIRSLDNLKLKFHFGVMDACIQGLFMLLPRAINNPFVASRIGKLKFFDTNISNLYMFAKFNEMSANQEEFYCTWYLMNGEDEVIMECENITMKKLTQSIKLERIRQAKEEIEYDWAPLTLEKRKQKIIQYLRSQVETIFSMPQEDIDILRSLRDMGMDSLMALVLMKAIESGFGVTYSMQLLLQGPSIADIADIIMQEKEKQNITDSKNNVIIESPKASTINPWIAYRQTPADPKIRLFCFPYGGGGASSYRNWSKELPDSVDVCPVQLPGREDRIDELAILDFNTMIDALMKNLESEMNIPFVFFGHSFGSLISFELTRRLRKLDLPMPKHLFISAYPDPMMPTKSLDNLLTELRQVNINLFDLNKINALSKLSNEQLNNLIMIFNKEGVSDYDMSMMNADAMKLLLPIFIADMEIVKSYQYHVEPPLDIPITVFYGIDDTWVLPDDLKGWSEQTIQTCDFYKIMGGHLFIKQHPHLIGILQQISKSLSSLFNSKI